jgi:3',5'-cyclic AMP phosphodiesterase CpdA
MPSRREAIKSGLVTTAAALTGGVTVVSAAALRDSAPPAQRDGVKPFRVAHLTDMHVQPERRGGQGWEAALKSLWTIDPKPQLILTGGDHIMDAFGQDPARCKLQYDLYQRVLKDNVPADVPVRAALGNHDVAGWGALEKFTPQTAGYGKAMALERLGIPGAYYSFDAGGWHFVMLDSIARRQESYFGELGEAQTEWLKSDLSGLKSGVPVCVTSHLPILGVAVFYDGDRLKGNTWEVPDSFMHRDMAAIGKLMAPFGVKLLLSGHIHLVDRCDYRGRTYICDGAVSGAWWKGPYHDTPEGYGIIDFWPDGSFDHKYVTYGWQAEKEPDKS